MDADLCLGVAVTPDEAAKSLGEWVEKDFGIEKTGTYWAPRGPRSVYSYILLNQFANALCQGHWNC